MTEQLDNLQLAESNKMWHKVRSDMEPGLKSCAEASRQTGVTVGLASSSPGDVTGAASSMSFKTKLSQSF